MGQCYSKNAVALKLSQAIELTAEITMRTQVANVNRERYINNLKLLEVCIRARKLTLCQEILRDTMDVHTVYIIAKEASFDLRTKCIQLLPTECSTDENTQLVQDKADHKEFKAEHAKNMKRINLHISNMEILEVLRISGI